MKTAFVALALPAVIGHQCATKWSQCNGQNWPYGVCCEDPAFECNYKNEYLSLCEPKPQPCKDAEGAPNNKHVCSTNYSQCNGQNWPFGVCCQDPNFECKLKNQYLSLCEPKKRPGMTADTGKCSTKWSQCNGQNWPFGVCCEDPEFECNYKNQYLSLCEPKSKAGKEVEAVEVGVWGQCGGKGYNGDATCAAGSSCTVINEWYSQCIPSQNKQCAQNGSQCNGQNWPFGVCCASPHYQCNYKSQYLSLCEPKTEQAMGAPTTAQQWQQCGGQGHNGPTTCVAGNTCRVVTAWYSQCQPTPATDYELPTYAQCAGTGYTDAGKKCRAADTCFAYSATYSQCIPQ